ncbi:hypothetical protein ACFQX4_28795, partial [Roseomonas sp. GCM10028921]
YKHLGEKQTHLAVNHGQREYARTDEATGYASEAAHRWNHRAYAVMDRLAAMVRDGTGRVLSDAFLTARAA